MVAGTILLSLSAVGCVAEPYEDGEAILAAESADSIIIMNGVDPLFFWQPSTQQALRALAAAPLDVAINGGAGQTLLSSAKGQELLAHVVGCSLAADQEIQSAGGASFEGGIGLAPAWKTQPLSGAAPRRWVTACLLQSLNGLGAHVPVRLTGHHPALATDPSDPTFTVPDATMFGNLFDPLDPAAFACLDTAFLDGCGVSWSIHTLQRICGVSPTCGLALLGPCALSCTHDATGASTCTEPQGGVYLEAISSTLEQTIVLSADQVCSGDLLP